MAAGSSIPVQALHGLSKSTLFGAEQTGFDELDLPIGGAAVTFAPFTGDGGGALESTTASERDLLVMEHLPTVRYLARRIHERVPPHGYLDDLMSAGGGGVIDCFSE